MAQLNDLLVTGASRLLNGLGILGSTNADSILPNTTDTYSLGSSSKRWNVLYAKTSNIDTETVGTLTVTNYATIGANQAATGTGTGALRVSGGISATQNSWFGGNITTTKNISATGSGSFGGALSAATTVNINGDWESDFGLYLQEGSSNGQYGAYFLYGVNDTLKIGTMNNNDKVTAITIGRGSSNVSIAGTVTAPTFSGALSGNATTATTLKTARTLTIGNTGKSFNGSANVSWTIAEIGAVNKTGDTMTGMLRVNNAPIFGYRYGQSNNAPAFVFDKPGSNYTGIGANGAADTIYFGAVSSDGNWNWVTDYKQKWHFNGNIIADNVSISSLTIPGGYVKKREDGTSYNCLGSYYASGSTAAYIRIALPVFSGWNMCQLEFSIRQVYGSGRTGKLIVYAHTSGSSSNWTQFYAVYHDTLTSAIKVYGSDNRYFYIAGVSAWGGLTLDKMVLGDAVTGTDMSNVVIDGVSALPATYQTATMLRSWVQGDSVTGAVWNDYAECRESDIQEPGYVLIEKGDDTLTKSTERMQPFAGVSSDTWGFSQGETERAKTHIAVAGRVLVYPYRPRDEYKPGDCVCAAPNGTVDIMTPNEVALHPDRIVGTVSCVPNYETWGGGELADRDPVQVNGRIWIKVR